MLQRILENGVLVIKLGLLPSMMLFTACGRAPATSELDIVGGRAVRSESDAIARTATVALTNARGLANHKSFCSSTLIGRHLLLTAAHCVSDQNGEISISDDTVAVFDTEVGYDDASIRKVTGVALHDGYDASVVGARDPRRNTTNDLALVRFADDAPFPYAPARVIPAGETLEVGHALTLAGFGVTATRNVNSTGRLRYVEARVTEVAEAGNVLILRGPRLNATAIDRDPVSGRLRRVPATGGSCAGDSGGPAYIRLADSSDAVAGVTSYGDELPIVGGESGVGYCVGDNGFMDVRHFAAFIAQAKQVLTSEHNVDQNDISKWRVTATTAERQE